MALAHPVLVVSYSDDSRSALARSLEQLEVEAIACASFVEAENLALQGIYSGILVDLTAMIKAKGEEKIVACSLTGFYPTLRVRTMGNILVPMIMPGGAKQDGSVKDFLAKSCACFAPRKLRAHRRHPLCLAVEIVGAEVETIGFTLDLSWGGAFVVQMHPERFEVGEVLELRLPEFDCVVRVEVRWMQRWGGRRAPGLGCRFLEPEDEGLAALLKPLLRSVKEQDRDRLLA